MNTYRISRCVTSIAGQVPKECFMPGAAVKGERICDCTTQCNYLLYKQTNDINLVRREMPRLWAHRHLGMRPLLSEKKKNT